MNEPTLYNNNELRKEFIRKCALLKLNSEVLMDGPFNAKIAVVGEAPGEHEYKSRIPMVGGAGRMLWDALRKISLTRKDVYTTNVIKRRMSLSATVKEARAKVSIEEKALWRELLLWELGQLPELRYVLLLGDTALRAIVPDAKDKISNWRGSVIERELHGKKIYYIPCFNPAAAIYDPKQEVIFRFDIAKLQRVMTGKYKPYNITAHINPTAEQALQWVREMHDDGIHLKRPIAYDIETLSGETACIGLANSAIEGMCINFRDTDTNRYTVKEEIAIRKAIASLLGDHRIRLVAQNGSFDAYWLWYKDRIHVHHNWFDTLLAHHTLYSQLPHSLAFLTAQYTDHPFYKDEGRDWKEGGDIDAFWNYNVKDCCITLACQRRLAHELDDAKMSEFFHDHVMKLQPHLVRMTVNGVLCDWELKKDISEKMSEDVTMLLNKFQDQVHKCTGEPDYNPNPNSWPQMKELYFSKLKLVGRGMSTNAENRTRMRNNPRTSEDVRQLLDMIDEYTREHKFFSTYVESKIDEDKRIRCEYKQFGTTRAPGRLSSSKTMWGSGMNLQNQPHRSYPMFVTSAGNAFGYFDLSQAEARVVGRLAKIDKWNEQFEKARVDKEYDCHRALASDMFNVPYEQTPTKDRNEDGTPTIRYIAKRCRHGLNYRMGPDRLATVTGLSIARAEEAYDIYHRATPELRTWWHSLEIEVQKNRVLYSPLGRRLIFMEKISPEALESIVAFKPQSTIGDKVSMVIYQAQEDERWPLDAQIRMNIHDALIVEAPVDEVTTCLQIMKHYAEQPITINGYPLIIPAECKISKPDEYNVHRWSTLEAVEI